MPTTRQRRSLSQKLSISSLRSIFRRNDSINNEDDDEIESLSSYYTEDHEDEDQQDDDRRGSQSSQTSRSRFSLRRSFSRLSLNSETRENTRRNSQSSSHSNHLRSQNSLLNLRGFGIELQVNLNRTVSTPPQPTGRARANTASNDGYDTRAPSRPRRGAALTSHPPSMGFATRPSRNDSAAHAQASEEVERPGSPSGSSHYDSDGSNDTIRNHSPSPRYFDPLSGDGRRRSRTVFEEQQARPPSPPSPRRKSSSSRAIHSEQQQRPPSRVQFQEPEQQTSTPPPLPQRHPSRRVQLTPVQLAPVQLAPRPPDLSQHPAFRTNSPPQRSQSLANPPQSLVPDPLFHNNPRRGPLRRVRGVEDFHQPSQAQAASGNYQLPSQDFGGRELMWQVGADLCNRAEMQEIERLLGRRERRG